MSKILINIITKLLTMLLAATYAIGLINYSYDSFLIFILGLILSIFIFVTSIVDMIRIKNINNKTNVLNLILVSIMLFNIYRPFLDSLLLDNLIFDFEINASFSLSLLHQNFLLITIFMIILFLINFNFKTK